MNYLYVTEAAEIEIAPHVGGRYVRALNGNSSYVEFLLRNISIYTIAS